jgi:hypothetical protein
MSTPTPSRVARPCAITALIATALLSGGAARAIDYGPFSLTGFGKAEGGRVSSRCKGCQVDPTANKQFVWADEVVQGKDYGAGNSHVTLFQPYLGVKFDLPKGFKVQGLLSQRYRDGNVDFPGFWYEKNVALSHDDYGSVRIGAMTTRGWSVADYPYGSNVGVADIWGSAGAGYGILTRAVRVQTRALDVLEGDLVLEATYDQGKSGWNRNKPRFWELYAQFHKGDLVIDAIYQKAQNGTPSAFGHGVFTGLTPFPADDAKLGSSSQGIAMVMARYQVDSKIEVSGGLRANRWSGAYARITRPASSSASGFDEWNDPFNVDWSKDLGGGVYKGYPATSMDIMLGLRWRFAANWTASTGFTHLGPAATENPSDRGQSNAATVNTIGLNYDFKNGLQVYGSGTLVNYARRGLAPLSMPSNSAFTNIDSRLKSRGNSWLLGAVYTF